MALGRAAMSQPFAQVSWVKKPCVEKESVGGVCLNVGCIPSKALINAAKQYDKMLHSDAMGITVTGATVDVSKLMNWKGGIVNKLTGGVRQLIKSAGGQIIQGTAKLRSAKQVEDQTKGPLLIEADSIILATGSRPITVPGFTVDNQRIHDSTGGLSLKSVPKRLAVIGGGYIGLSLASCGPSSART